MRREEALRKYEQYLARIKKWFPLIERWFPFGAHRFAFWLFFKPFHFPTPPKEQAAAAQAELDQIKVGKHKVQVYSWGAGKPVVFIHGWSGRGLQVFKFLPSLVKNGFRVIAFDAPGHGQSTGKHSDVSLFRDCLFEIEKLYGPLYALVGHSIGGGAALLAIKEGLQVEKLVVIGTPSNGPDVLKGFLDRIGASEKTGQYLDLIVQKRHGRTLDQFSAHISALNMPYVNTLLVYDTDDTDVPLYHGENLHSILKDSKMLVTEGFGHTRILRGDLVVNTVASFLKVS